MNAEHQDGLRMNRRKFLRHSWNAIKLAAVSPLTARSTQENQTSKDSDNWPRKHLGATAGGVLGAGAGVLTVAKGGLYDYEFIAIEAVAIPVGGVGGELAQNVIKKLT